MPKVSVNEVQALWVGAEQEIFEMMADEYEERQACLLEFGDEDPEDDLPPSSPVRPAAVLWELEDDEEAA